MSSVSITPKVEIMDAWSIKTVVSNNNFYIVRAKIEDAAAIIKVAQESYYQQDIEVLKLRDIKLKDEFGIVDVPRRINAPHVYTVLVCKVKGESEDRSKDKIVGTVYYQPNNTDYIDEKGREVAELGLLAVDPLYRRVNEIGLHLIKTVEELAVKDGQRGIYLYVKVAQKLEASHNNGLVRFYQQKGGYEIVANRTSPGGRYFSDKSVNLAMMLRSLNTQTSQTKIKTIQHKKHSEVYPIPE